MAAIKAGLPIALASFGLVRWALSNEFIGDANSLKDIEKEMKRLSKEQDQDKKRDKKRDKKKRKAADNFSEELEQSLSMRELLHPGGQPNKKLNPVLNKWLSFGGGFYGIVGLLTYAVVELGEIAEFFREFESVANFFKYISFNMIIQLFIEGLMNFIVAIAWPIYWLDMIAGEFIWIWFLIAYGAYWLGAKLALAHYHKPDNDPENI